MDPETIKFFKEKMEVDLFKMEDKYYVEFRDRAEADINSARRTWARIDHQRFLDFQETVRAQVAQEEEWLQRQEEVCARLERSTLEAHEVWVQRNAEMRAAIAALERERQQRQAQAAQAAQAAQEMQTKLNNLYHPRM